MQYVFDHFLFEKINTRNKSLLILATIYKIINKPKIYPG